MAQYCRYCEYIVTEQGSLYCPIKDRYISEKYAKHTNECDEFLLNPIDAIRTNRAGYKPTGIKPVELGGLGKQIRIQLLFFEFRQAQSERFRRYDENSKLQISG